MTTQLVSVIIPTYNRATYVTQAIESALLQSYVPVEIVVVDDGSTDDTQRVLAPYSERINYIYQGNQGEAVARNTGIAASCGDYVAFLDSDDVWFSSKLSKQMSYLSAHPEVGMVASHAIAIDKYGVALDGSPLFPAQSEGWVTQENNILRSPLPIDTVVVRRNCLPKPTPFPSGVEFGADWEMCLRVGANHKIWFLGEVLAGVRVHEGNITNPLASQQQIDRKLQSRLGVIERVFATMPGDDSELALLRLKAKAREYAEAAIPSYAKGTPEKGISYLQQAVVLDPTTWQDEELVALICNFAKLLYQKQGKSKLMDFLENIRLNMPHEVEKPQRLLHAIYARTLIFTTGFSALEKHRPREAVTSIIKGLAHRPAYLTNIGVLTRLARSIRRSLASER